MWNERRHQGQVTEVGAGCKSDHSCLNQMIGNFKWETISGEKKITGERTTDVLVLAASLGSPSELGQVFDLVLDGVAGHWAGSLCTVATICCSLL